MDKIPFSAYDFFGHLAPGIFVVAGLAWVIDYPPVLRQEPTAFGIALTILAVYMGGHIAAVPAKAVLEDFFVGRLLGKPSAVLLGGPRPWYGRLFPGYFTALTDDEQVRVKERASRADGTPRAGEDLFKHVRYHETTKTNERLMTKLETFVGLYGFARNMSFVCLVIALSLGVKIWAGYGAPRDGTRAALLAITAVLLLYRYLKYHRQYSYEMFSVFGSSKESK